MFEQHKNLTSEEVGKLSCNCIDPIQSYHKKMGNMGWSFKTRQDLCKSKIVTVSRCWFCPLCSTSFECSIDDCPQPPETKHIRTKIVESSLKIYSQHQHSKWTSPCHFLWNSCPYSRPALHTQWPCNFPSKSRTPVILCRVQYLISSPRTPYKENDDHWQHRS